MKLKEMVGDLVIKRLMPKCQRCKSIFRLQVIQKVAFSEVVSRYRNQMAGISFTRQRWRRFYARNQIFITLCMECAYLDNMRAQEMKQEGKHGKEDERQAAKNAIKQAGSHNFVVKRNLKKKHVRNVIRRWIQLAKSNILHGVKEKPILEDDYDDDSN